MADTTALTSYLIRLPSVGVLASGDLPGGGWWIKLTIATTHSLAWNVVQELAHVLNYLSLEDRLPTVFKPVSPPPYMNGGPADYLSWVIECEDPAFPPEIAANWLETHLPSPVDDANQWCQGDT